MSGAIHQLPQYAFMAWWSVKNSTGTTLPFFSGALRYYKHVQRQRKIPRIRIGIY